MITNNPKIQAAQAVRDWFVGKILKDTVMIRVDRNNRVIIIKTASEDFPYAEITVNPMTKEEGEERISDLDELEAYRIHKRNLVKLKRERGK